MPENARKTRWYSTGGPWGTGLLLLGVAVTVIGLNMLTADRARQSGPVRALSVVLPLWALGGLWVAAGLHSVWQALTPPQRHRDVLPVVAITSLWALAYLAYWLVTGAVYGRWSREWSGGVGWGSLTMLIISWGRCVNPPRRR
ncbi:MAG TPA: hypothetical protein VFV01_16925 [Spirillospora sp.]|nr:hypothetical protein [Spirillospora sp.]